LADWPGVSWLSVIISVCSSCFGSKLFMVI
jgi:hypothetical protein